MDFFVFHSQNLNASALLLCNYLGVDMGEQRALGESIVGNMGLPAFLQKDVYPSFAENVACLGSFHADMPKYVHLGASCYNNCKTGLTPEADLIVKDLNGEKNA
jgi:hypothetical protein